MKQTIPTSLTNLSILSKGSKKAHGFSSAISDVIHKHSLTFQLGCLSQVKMIQNLINNHYSLNGCEKCVSSVYWVQGSSMCFTGPACLVTFCSTVSLSLISSRLSTLISLFPSLFFPLCFKAMTCHLLILCTWKQYLTKLLLSLVWLYTQV